MAPADVWGIAIPAERKERISHQLIAEEVENTARSTLEYYGRILLPIQGE